jgi:hypothetical protein
MKAYLITFILYKRLTQIGHPDQKLQIFYWMVIWWIDQSSVIQTTYLICRTFHRYITDF